MILKWRQKRRGQTVLEYMMLVVVVVLPIAAAFQATMEDDGKKKNGLIKKIVKDAYGEGSDMGVIGRPYP